MRRRRRPTGGNDNFERWLLTYADLITLLLAFFIVMYSMSSVDDKKFDQVTSALNGVLKGGKSLIEREGTIPSERRAGRGIIHLGNLDMIRERIDQRFSRLQRRDEIETEITERGLVIHVLESALFAEGEAELQPRAQEVLDLIATELVGIPNHVRVEGHTDDRPIQTLAYPTNWELSASRATRVVRYYIENFEIYPGRISALGYGRYRPIVPNNSIENRARNRRVDVVILTMDLTLKEPSSQLFSPDFAAESNSP